MTNLIFFMATILCFTRAQGATHEDSLQQEMQKLDLPSNVLPAAANREKIYVIQDRFLPLKSLNEISLGVGQDLTSNSYLISKQVELNYRYHIDSNWALGVQESLVSTNYSSAAKRLGNYEASATDIPLPRSRTDLTGEYNVFYGKLRFDPTRVFYFDQYVGFGLGFTEFNTGLHGTLVADIGLVFWISKWGSARLGLKDYFDTDHNILGHFNLGIVF